MHHQKSEGVKNARHNPTNDLSNNQAMSARDEQSWIEYEILAEKRINELSTELKSAVAARDMFAREVGTFMGELTKLRENRDGIKIQADAATVTLRSELANAKKELKDERKYTNTYIKLLHREQFERKHLADELDAYNDAIDAQPWATSEPIRVLLDRVTVALALGDKFRADLARVTAERDEWKKWADAWKTAGLSDAAKSGDELREQDDGIAALRSRNAELVAVLRSHPPIHADPDSPISRWMSEASEVLAHAESGTPAPHPDTVRLDWLEREHDESDGEYYLVECSITYNGNTGAPPLFPATRAQAEAAMGGEK